MQKNKVMRYLAALFAVLVGWLYFERSKRKSAESLLDNQETKEKLLEHDKEIVKSEARIEVEAEKRSELEESLKKVEKDVSIEELEDFFKRDPNSSNQ